MCFEGHMVSVTITPLSLPNVKAAIDNLKTNGSGYVQIKLYLCALKLTFYVSQNTSIVLHLTFILVFKQVRTLLFLWALQK